MERSNTQLKQLNEFSIRQAAYLRTIINDMKLPHQGRPHGVPASYNWAKGPRVGMGNRVQGFQAFIAWGQLYEAAEGNTAVNTRVQIKGIRTYFLSKKDKKWYLVQRSKTVAGAAYREDFVDDIHKPANVRVEPDGSISVKAGKGYNFHFWANQGRIKINPHDIGGVITSVNARLVLDNPQQIDDRSQAKYLLSMGADYWTTLTAKWDNWKTNADAGIGRFKYVTPEWQTFNMTTLSPAQLRRYSPHSLFE